MQRSPVGETELGRCQFGKDTGTRGPVTTPTRQSGSEIKPGFLRFVSSAHQ